MHYHLIGLNCRYSHSCLSLFYVREELRRRFPQADITLDQWTINDPYYDTLLKISGADADIVFFSVYIWNADYIGRLIEDLTVILPDTPIILGGPQAPAMGNLPENCTIVEGEIEGVAEDFYNDLESVRLKRHYLASPASLFSSPYVDEDFIGPLQNRTVYYESSRGCPFRCSYCLSSLSKCAVHKDVDLVRQELDAILVHRPKIIKFVDRTFNDHPERALSIWKYLQKTHGETRFHFEIAPDRFSEDMMEFLEKVPPDLFQFEIGIQSTNEETLNAINRKMDVGKATENIRRLVQFDNVHLHVDLILGLPFETEESFRSSFNRVFALGAHYIQMGLLKVLPGTMISKQVKEFGLKYCTRPPYQIMANRWLAHQQLGYLYAFGECVEAFYNNRYFRSLWKYLRERNEEPFVFFRRLLAIRRNREFVDLAPTQELLTRIICEAAIERGDREMIHELLRYDWLRCGHRFLPQAIAVTYGDELRNELWENLPQNIDGLYTHRERRGFFKRSVFLKMSSNALQQVGLNGDGKDGIVCFLADQTGGVVKHSRTVVMEYC